MIKKNLLKAFALGLCMSAIFTGTAFAQTGGGVSPSSQGAVSEESNVLYEKQAEIDLYVFSEHAKDIKKQGFQVYYTGVADDYVEIGISPYNEKNANYLYDIFGKDIVKVVASDEPVLYATTEAGNAASDMDETVAVDAQIIMDKGDTPVASTDEKLLKDRETLAAEDDEKLEIQIESLPTDVTEEDAPDAEADLTEEEAAELAKQSGIAEDGQDAQLVSAQDDAADLVATTSDKDHEGISAPTIILIVAGGAIVIGGVLFATKKKTDR